MPPEPTMPKMLAKLLEEVPEEPKPPRVVPPNLEQLKALIPPNWDDMFKINLWAENSSMLLPPKPADGEDEVPPTDFEWHSEAGLYGCHSKIRNEFVSKHNLKPIKIILSGHEDSGKTHFSKMLSESYKIPVLSMKDIFDSFPPPAVIGDEDMKNIEPFAVKDDYLQLKDDGVYGEGVDSILKKFLSGDLRE